MQIEPKSGVERYIGYPCLNFRSLNRLTPREHQVIKCVLVLGKSIKFFFCDSAIQFTVYRSRYQALQIFASVARTRILPLSCHLNLLSSSSTSNIPLTTSDRPSTYARSPPFTHQLPFAKTQNAYQMDPRE